MRMIHEAFERIETLCKENRFCPFCFEDNNFHCLFEKNLEFLLSWTVGGKRLDWCVVERIVAFLPPHHGVFHFCLKHRIAYSHYEKLREDFLLNNESFMFYLRDKDPYVAESYNPVYFDCILGYKLEGLCSHDCHGSYFLCDSHARRYLRDALETWGETEGVEFPSFEYRGMELDTHIVPFFLNGHNLGTMMWVGIPPLVVFCLKEEFYFKGLGSVSCFSK